MAALGKPAPDRWELLFWLWLAYFLNQADRQIFNILLPLIRADLGLSDTAVGTIASLFTLFFGLAVPLGGYIGDRFSRKWACTLSLGGWSLATVATGSSSTLTQFIAFRSVATGAGEAVFAPSNYALIADRHVETRSLAMSIHQTSLYAGLIASGAIAGWIGQTYGWQAAFFAFGLAGVLVAGAMAVRLRDYATGAPVASGERPSFLAAIAFMVRSPKCWMLALAFGGFVAVNVGYLTWMPTLLGEKFGYSIAAAGFASMFWCHAAAFAGILIAGRWSDRLVRTRPQSRLLVQAGGLFLMAPFVFLMGVAPSAVLTFAALALFGFTRGFYDANIFASLYDIVPAEIRATAASVMISFAFIVGAAAPVALAAVKTAAGLSDAIATLSIPAVVAGICLLIATKMHSPEEEVRA